MLSRLRYTLLILVCLLSACASNAPQQIPKPQLTTESQFDEKPLTAVEQTDPIITTGVASSNANITHETLAEISGITAASAPNIRFWAINDSGNGNTLFAIGRKGELLKQYPLAAPNRDWESLSRMRIGDQTLLIVGDTGDNLRHHDNYTLHFVVEPTLANNTSEPLKAISTLTFRFSDGKHNVEAMAATGNTIYLITKEPLLNGEAVAGKLFRLNLDGLSSDTEQVAKYLGEMQLRTGSLSSSLAASLAGVDLNQATALSFSVDQSAAYLLTYRQVVRFTKKVKQSWSNALLDGGNVIHTHGLRQAEAMTIDDEGVLWFTSEKLPAPIWALPTYSRFE